MKVQIDSVFRGLGATLKEVMNLPAEPTSVALTMDQLRIEAELKVDIKVLNMFREEERQGLRRCCGEVSVTWLPSIN